jgi:hypothetical protein
MYLSVCHLHSHSEFRFIKRFPAIAVSHLLPANISVSSSSVCYDLFQKMIRYHSFQMFFPIFLYIPILSSTTNTCKSCPVSWFDNLPFHSMKKFNFCWCNFNFILFLKIHYYYVDIVTYWGLCVTYKTGFGLDNWIYCALHIHKVRKYRQYSAIAILHTFQFTVPHALGFCLH